MSTPMDTFLSGLTTALSAMSCPVTVQRDIEVQHKSMGYPKEWVTIVPMNDNFFKAESKTSYLVHTAAMLRVSAVSPTDAAAIAALTSLIHDIRDALYGQSFGGRRFVDDGLEFEFKNGGTDTNLIYAECELKGEYQEVVTGTPLPSLRLGYPFEAVVQNAAAPSVSIIISNPGTALLTISGVTAPSGFTASSVPASVAVGETATFTLSLDSTATIGTFTGTVTVNSNAGTLSADVSAEVTADSRLTRIPILVLPGYAVGDLRVYPTAAYQWQIPDGLGGWTYQRVATPVYMAPIGNTGTYIYILMDAGRTVADLTYVIAIGSGCIYDLANFYLCRFTSTHFYFEWVRSIFGNIAIIGSVVENVTSQILLIPYTQNEPYGDVSGWPALKPVRIYFHNLSRVHGSFNFIAGAPTNSVFLGWCTAFTPAEHSQTIINWDDCNAGVFARTGLFNMTKRSQLTAAGEAAVVSLIAKNTTFTFKAE